MPLDDLPRRGHRRQRHVNGVSMATGGIMPQSRSPLEEAIAAKKDRRVRYESKMKREGFKKITLWVPVDCLDLVRELVRLLGATNGWYRKALRTLIDGKPREPGE